jgi:hypothetical protein
VTHYLFRPILILALTVPASAERFPFEISMTAAMESAAITEVVSHAAASPWRVVQSISLGEPPSHFSWTQHPKVSVTEAGFCAAWLDRRQGGAILAARITADGTVLDPTGIPLAALGDKAPWVVFSAPGGCVVGWNLGATLHGQFIPDDPNEAPRPAFTITVPHRILRAEHDRLLVWTRDWNGDSLRLYDARGVQLGFLDFGAIDPQFVPRVLEIDGRLIMLSTTSKWERGWIHELDSSLSATLLGRTEENTLPRSFAVAGTEAGLIAVGEVSSSGSEIELEWVEVALDGELIAAGETTIPVGGTLSGMREISGESRLVIRGHSGNTFLVSDIRAANPRIEVIEGTDLVVASSGTRTIFVSYGHRPDGTRGHVFEIDVADGHGEPLTESRVDQRLHDTAAEGGHAALLWSEKEIDRNRLLLGIFSGEEKDLTATLTVAELDSEWGRNPELAAVETEQGVILVVWSEYAEERYLIRYRRASIEGGWLDEVKTLPAVGHVGADNGGLVRSEGEFVLVFSGNQTVNAARIGVDGAVEITMISSGTTDRPIVLAVDEGFVFMTAQGRSICEFICLVPMPITIWLDLYDHRFLHLGSLTPSKGLGGAGIPYMEAGDDTILVGSERGAYLFERLAVGIWSGAREIDVAGGTAASWVEDRYLVAGHRVVHSQSLGTNDSAILIGEVMPEGNAFAALAPIVVDWVAPRGSDPTQRVHQLGDRLFLFANAITLEPEQAFVRRIRAHELVREEGPVRRRAVGRR